MIKEVLKYLPQILQYEIDEQIKNNSETERQIEEIRLRVNRRASLKIGQEVKILKTIITQNDIKNTFEKICENSIYSYIKQISEGFITIEGGNRVGIVGSCVLENEKVTNINYISSLNFRIARQLKEVSIPFLKYVIDLQNDTIFNTIIASPPGGGKTTILRDLIRKISNGMPEINFTAKTCGVVDERGEIAASAKGIPQNDLGNLTDIIENVPKHTGMKILIRSMAPQIIACDEIGSKEDIEAIKYAINSGVKGIFTYHAQNLEEVMSNREIEKLITNKTIQNIIVLDMKEKGKIKEIYKN